MLVKELYNIFLINLMEFMEYDIPEDAKKDIYDIIHGRKNLMKEFDLKFDDE